MIVRNNRTGIVSKGRRCAIIACAFLAALPAFAQKGNVGKLVVVGDSLSAGFQNFSLFNSDTSPIPFAGGQKHGYAALVAAQAGASLTLPLISFPGIPPALVLDPSLQIVRAAGIGARENPAVQATDISVPGFSLANALAYDFPGSPTTNAIDAMNYSIFATGTGLCGPVPVGRQLYTSEVACAVQLKPKTILVSIGNNDALQALTGGVPPTPPAVFAQQFLLFLAGLSAAHAQIFVSNIPDVTSIPYLVPIPAFKAACASPIPALPASVTNADFAVLDITNPKAVSFNLCTNYAIRSASMIAQTKAAVIQYNRSIAAEARLFDATVVDVNSLFAQLSANNYKVGTKTLTTGFLGGLFSLDGIHPTNTGYAILANLTIQAMNQELHTSIPQVNVANVAAMDPLILP